MSQPNTAPDTYRSPAGTIIRREDASTVSVSSDGREILRVSEGEPGYADFVSVLPLR